MGDDGVPYFVASSMYDTKPIHYISMLLGQIEWIKITKTVWDVDNERWENVKFLRMNFINNYNFTMGQVDISDHLQGNY